MKYLMLTPGFNPFGIGKDSVLEIKHEQSIFPGGEPHIRLSPFIREEDVTIVSRVNSSEDMMKLLIAHEAVRDSGYAATIRLFLPYFPGARQDRVCNPGEALTCKVYAKLINDMDLDEVIIFDSHSDVAPALLENCYNMDNCKFVHEVLKRADVFEQEEIINLVSPDAGALKKVYKVAKFLSEKYPDHMINVVKADKIRNTKTNEISGFEVHGSSLLKKPCFVIDDICDGGGTFIGLAKELKSKNAGNLHLIVSHGIFSKGFQHLLEYYESIITTDSRFNKDDEEWRNAQIQKTHVWKDGSFDKLDQVSFASLID